MYKCLIYIGIFLLLTVSISSLIFFAFIRGYNAYNEHEIEMLREKINGKEKNDIVFLGSSRTYYHMNPRVIDSVTGLSSFNAGIDGAGIHEMKIMFDTYASSHPKIKMLVIEVSWHTLSDEWRRIFNPNMYFPFLDNENLYNSLKPFERVGFFKYLPFLQLTQLDDPLRQGAISGLYGEKRYNDTDFYKGHLQSGADTITFPFKKKYLSKYLPISKNGVECLTSIIKQCRDQNIQPVLIYPPIWNRKDEDIDIEIFPTLQNLSARYNIPFLNYRVTPLSHQHKMFRDEIHLNKTGADKFSEILSEDLLDFFHKK